jgi:hypothetical protein
MAHRGQGRAVCGHGCDFALRHEAPAAAPFLSRARFPVGALQARPHHLLGRDRSRLRRLPGARFPVGALQARPQHLLGETGRGCAAPTRRPLYRRSAANATASPAWEKSVAAAPLLPFQFTARLTGTPRLGLVRIVVAHAQGCGVDASIEFGAVRVDIGVAADLCRLQPLDARAAVASLGEHVLQ